MQKTPRNNPAPLKLFALLTCSHCKAVKELLTEMEVAYQLVQVDLLTGEERSIALRELKSVNPQCTFPTLVAGDVVIVGYKADDIRKAFS